MQYAYYVNEKKTYHLHIKVKSDIFIHLMKFELNVSVLSIDFKPEDKLFQIMGPEYVMLCFFVRPWGNK